MMAQPLRTGRICLHSRKQQVGAARVKHSGERIDWYLHLASVLAAKEAENMRRSHKLNRSFVVGVVS